MNSVYIALLGPREGPYPIFFNNSYCSNYHGHFTVGWSLPCLLHLRLQNS
jgi:hypothetical protein